MDQSAPEPPRLESLHIRNFRALRDFRLEGLTPFTVLLGPNGSGKSTVLDALGFLQECFRFRLNEAWDGRGRGAALRSRGGSGPIEIDISIRMEGHATLRYGIVIDDKTETPEIQQENLVWISDEDQIPCPVIKALNGNGEIALLDNEYGSGRVERGIGSATLFAPLLARVASDDRLRNLVHFVKDFSTYDLSAGDLRGIPEVGARERLTPSGDNLPNVLQFLQQRHPAHLTCVLDEMRRSVPTFKGAVPFTLGDGRLSLRVKDTPFADPIQARNVSDGTLKLLACLMILNDPNPPSLIGLEEPENFIHPKLLHELGEKCRAASARSQIIATTHSPQFLNALQPEEVRILWRDATGYTQSKRASEIPAVRAMMDAGALMGDLWMEGYLEDFPPADGGP